MRDPYFNRKEVSNSDLSNLKKELYGGIEFDPTEAYRFGTLIDNMITEPGKVNYIDRTCENEGEFELETFELARQMKRAYLKDPICKMMLENSDPQAVMVFNDMLFDYSTPFKLNVRCKWDLWMPAFNWGGDIKSTVATTQDQFIAACKHFDYDRSRFWYMNIAEHLTGKPVEKDILIGISKKAKDQNGLPKIFKFTIEKGDEFYNKGKEKALDLAYKWWLRFGDV